jgi:hypothetical protein
MKLESLNPEIQNQIASLIDKEITAIENELLILSIQEEDLKKKKAELSQFIQGMQRPEAVAPAEQVFIPEPIKPRKTHKTRNRKYQVTYKGLLAEVKRIVYVSARSLNSTEISEKLEAQYGCSGRRQKEKLKNSVSSMLSNYSNPSKTPYLFDKVSNPETNKREYVPVWNFSSMPAVILEEEKSL